MRIDLGLVTAHPRSFLLLSLGVLLAFGAFAPFVQTANNVDYFTLEEHPAHEFYQEFKQVFGNDEFFVIAFEKDDIFKPENLRLIKEVTRELESRDLVREVTSLANVDHIVGEEQNFYVSPFLDEIPESKEGLAKLRKEALENPLYVKNLISPDARATAIVVFAKDRTRDENYRQKLLNATHTILEPHKETTEFHLAGWTVTNYRLSQYMQKDLATFIPLTYLLITAVVFLFFRNIRLTVLAVVTISACLASTMGLFRILGIPINNVTSIVPPLVMALALADVVHIFSHMQHSVLEQFPERRKALRHVLNFVAAPCLLTTVTTAIGFLSLGVSELEPIRQFAVLASAGMVFEFFFAFFLLPPLILFFDPKKVYLQLEERRFLTSGLAHMGRFVRTYYKPIVGLGCMIVLASMFFATKVNVETNLVKFFRSSSPERQSLQFVESRLSGVGILDISLKGGSRDAFKNPENLRVMENIQDFVEGMQGVDLALSFNHFLKDMNESFHNERDEYYQIPQSGNLISQYLLLYDSDDIEEYINRDYSHARIMIRLSEHSSQKQARIIGEIRSFIQNMDTKGLSVQVTGQVLQDVNTIDALVTGQIKSLALALGTISLLMFLVLKSISIGFLSLIPNIFPLVVNFGIMGFLGIPLNTATSLIAAVALGIAVDDTIHFLSHYHSRRKANAAIDAAVQETILTKGRALVSTSLILCIGFGILVLSRFMPTAYFGFLSALIMITALVGDLVLLSAVLLLKHKVKGKLNDK